MTRFPIAGCVLPCRCNRFSSGMAEPVPRGADILQQHFLLGLSFVTALPRAFA